MGIYSYFYACEAMLLYLSASMRSKHVLYVAVMFAILFSGLRLNVGVDYLSYIDVFSKARDVEISVYEPLTIIFAKIGALFGSGEELVFFLYAAITLGGVFYYIYHLSPSRALSFYLFLAVPIYYLSTFNGVRQWAAIAMISVSLVFLVERKFIKMSVAILAGAMFHVSAFLMCVLPLFQFRYSRKIIVIALACSLLLPKFILIIIDLTPYANYMKGIRFEGGWSPLMPVYVGMLLYFPFYFRYFDKRVSINRSLIVLCNMNLASVFALIVGYMIEVDFLLLMRVNGYFIIQLVVLVPMWVEMARGDFIAFKYLVVIAVPSVYLAYTLLVNGNYYMLTPYQTIFGP